MLHCCIVLEICDSDFENTNGASPADAPKKAVHTDRVRSRKSSKITAQSPLKVQKNIHVMSNRIKLVAEKALKKIVVLKKNCDKNIREKTREKIESEMFLRIYQCKVIELKLSLFEVADCKELQDKTDNLTSVEEMIKKLEGIVHGMVLELQVLGKEKEDLSEKLEKAGKFYYEILKELNLLEEQ